MLLGKDKIEIGNSSLDLRVKVHALLGSPWAMVPIALAVRLVIMRFVYVDLLDPARDHWNFGWETGKVARSIVMGQGFSSPYSQPSGPTALIPPVYTYLVAGVFKLFGIFTAASALVILTLNNLFSSLTCAPVFLIARRVFGLRVARLAGWTWAFFPYAAVLSNTIVWETVLSTLLFSLLLLWTLHLERSTSLIAWTGYGLLWGVATLSNPATVSTVPFLLGWICFRRWRDGRRIAAEGMIAACIVLLLVVTPWIWRCSRTYGRFVPIRSGLGLELLVGNSLDTSNYANWSVLPSENDLELKKLRTVGESKYMAEKQHEAVEYIIGHPLQFAGQTVRRILYTWTCIWNFHPVWNFDSSGMPNILVYTLLSLFSLAGITWAIQNHRDNVIPLVILIIVFPLVYYMTHPDIRFRHLIDPVIVIFFSYGLICFRTQLAESSEEERVMATTGSPAVGDL